MASEVGDGQALEGFLAIERARLASSFREQRIGELLAATRSARDHVGMLGGRDEVRESLAVNNDSGRFQGVAQLGPCHELAPGQGLTHDVGGARDRSGV